MGLPTLETDRLILRPLVKEDANAIFSYASNSNVCKYTLWEAHQTLADSLSFINDYAIPNYAKNIPEPFGITLKERPDIVIGTVGCFWSSEKHKIMELAYALSEKEWGKGITAEAAKAVIDFCFSHYDVKRIQARCKSENINSLKVMEKAGMTFEGTLKASVFVKNKFWDMHYAAIINEG